MVAPLATSEAEEKGESKEAEAGTCCQYYHERCGIPGCLLGPSLYFSKKHLGRAR